MKDRPLKIGDVITLNIPPMREGVGPVTFDRDSPDVCGCRVVGVENDKLVIDLCIPHFIALQHNKLDMRMPSLPTDFGDTGMIPCLFRRLIPIKAGEDGLFEIDGTIAVSQMN